MSLLLDKIHCLLSKKRNHNIVVMLPFHLDYGPNYSKYVSNLSTQFYMGAKLALDELEMAGAKC